MKLLVILSATLVLSYAAPTTDDLAKFNQLKDANATFATIRLATTRITFIQSLLNQTKTSFQFLAVNEDYRRVLSRIISYNGTTIFGEIQKWISYYRSSSITLADVKAEMRRTAELLTPFQNKVKNINQKRMNAVTLPLDQKVTAVNGTVTEFMESLAVLPEIGEQLEAALYDFQSYLDDA